MTRPSTSQTKLELARRYHFAASHRLHTGKLNAEANRQVFGKCNNPYGHGHNYVVEVAVSGPVDSATGMIANLVDLDAYVQRQVLDLVDHKDLNRDVPAFRDTVPTTENLCIEIFQRLKNFPNAKLERVLVEETGNNTFEYAGDAHTDSDPSGERPKGQKL